jgi:hypothetical protein
VKEAILKGEFNLRGLGNLSLTGDILIGWAPWHWVKEVSGGIMMYPPYFMSFFAPILIRLEYRIEHFKNTAATTSLTKASEGDTDKKKAAGKRAKKGAKETVEGEVQMDGDVEGPAGGGDMRQETAAVEGTGMNTKEAIAQVIEALVSCKNCKTGCQSGRCLCLKNKTACTSDCRCWNCMNMYGVGGRDQEKME